MRKIYKVKETLTPLFVKGDLFIITKRNKEPNLMPIEAKRLKDGEIYGFDENELEGK